MSTPDYSWVLGQGCPVCGSAPGANCVGGGGQRLGLHNMHAARGRKNVARSGGAPPRLRCPGRHNRACRSIEIVYLARRGRRSLVGCCQCHHEWITASRLANGLPSPDERARHDRKAEAARVRHQQILEGMGLG